MPLPLPPVPFVIPRIAAAVDCVLLSIPLIVTTAGWIRGRRLVRHTSLVTAWGWAAIAVTAHATAVLLPLAAGGLGIRELMAAHGAAATLMLAPLVSVLGSRRPGASAWPWFVVTPMVVVLLWPILNELIWTDADRPIDPGVPALTGTLLVLVMAAGNYLGTGNAGAALLYSLGVLAHLAPTTGIRLESSTASVLAAMLVAAAVVAGSIHLRTVAVPAESGEDPDAVVSRMWNRFRDQFGFVWARRVADRVNQFGERERWTVRLTARGFETVDNSGNPSHAASFPETPPDASGSRHGSSPQVSPPPDHSPDHSLERPLEVLCWVLRRFVDPPWLAEHLGPLWSAERHGGTLANRQNHPRNLPVSDR